MRILPDHLFLTIKMKSSWNHTSLMICFWHKHHRILCNMVAVWLSGNALASINIVVQICGNNLMLGSGGCGG